jgi:hypothetical protein
MTQPTIEKQEQFEHTMFQAHFSVNSRPICMIQAAFERHIAGLSSHTHHCGPFPENSLSRFCLQWFPQQLGRPASHLVFD